MRFACWLTVACIGLLAACTSTPAKSPGPVLGLKSAEAFLIDPMYSSKVATSSAEKITENVPVHVGYDSKGVYLVGGIIKIIDNEFTACEGQTFLFDESFKQAGVEFGIGGVTIRSDGKQAIFSGEAVGGVKFVDGKLVPIPLPGGP